MIIVTPCDGPPHERVRSARHRRPRPLYTRYSKFSRDARCTWTKRLVFLDYSLLRESKVAILSCWVAPLRLSKWIGNQRSVEGYPVLHASRNVAIPA